MRLYKYYFIFKIVRSIILIYILLGCQINGEKKNYFNLIIYQQFIKSVNNKKWKEEQNYKKKKQKTMVKTFCMLIQITLEKKK